MAMSDIDDTINMKNRMRKSHGHSTINWVSIVCVWLLIVLFSFVEPIIIYQTINSQILSNALEGYHLPFLMLLIIIAINSGIVYWITMLHYKGFRRVKAVLDGESARAYRSVRCDPLTGIDNRIAFKESISRIIQSDESHLIFQIELRDFFELFEVHGMNVCDRYMVHITMKLSELDNVHVYHTHGDLLQIIYQGSQIDEMLKIIEKIKRTLSNVSIIDGIRLSTECNIGIVRYPEDGRDFRIIEKHLQIATHQARSYGEGVFVVYKEHLNLKREAFRTMSKFIDDAIKDQSFRLYLQPIVDMKSCKVNKVELLLRHTELSCHESNIGELITVAETTGQIKKIDRWVIKRAFQMISSKDFRNKELVFSINLSAISLRSSEVFELFCTYLKKFDVEASRIEIEITEHSLMSDLEASRVVLDKFKAMGFRLALDDFGIAYSSLNYLSKLPIDVIKIDKEYIEMLDTTDNHRSIARLVITLAKELGMVSVAEGIETTQQKKILDDLGCQMGQGYLFDKALSTTKFLAKYF